MAFFFLQDYLITFCYMFYLYFVFAERLFGQSVRNFANMINMNVFQS